MLWLFVRGEIQGELAVDRIRCPKGICYLHIYIYISSFPKSDPHMEVEGSLVTFPGVRL